MKWKDKLINDLIRILQNDPEWSLILDGAIHENRGSIHLAVFNEPFLTMIFSGEKEIESRFSINNVAPFSRVRKGDIIIIKKSGGNIEGVFLAGETLYFSNLTQERLSQIEQQYGKKIGWHVDPDFFSNKSSANYLSLIFIDKVRKCVSETSKADRTAWSVLLTSFKDTLFEFKNE